MFRKVLVANRGAVAHRVLRCLRSLGVPSVAVYSDADDGAGYLELATECVRIGEAPPRLSYLNQDALLAAARATGCDALHPGYGFLAENAEFARRVQESGMTFIGPSPHHLAAMGHKARARSLARSHGLPVVAGTETSDGDLSRLREQAERIGFPLMVKPAAGGGGIGMIPVHSADELASAVARARSAAGRAFGDPEIFLERLLTRPRHIEVQILGDRHGNVCHLFERDCSVQRRNQKIIEEAPAPGVDRSAIESLAGRVTESLRRIGYDNIGTVELLRGEDGAFTFLEMNTRLQVEHGVTEAVCGVDLVAAQIAAAAGEPLSSVIPAGVRLSGHAIEARICAEDPVRFIPSPGTLTTFRLPVMPGLRVETGCSEGRVVSPHYDSLLAKLIAHGATRADAIATLIAGLEACRIEGVKTNIPALLKILRSAPFTEGRVHTGLVGTL